MKGQQSILDCDLLLGRDIATGRRVDSGALAAALAAAGIDGGLVGSLRALLFDAASGNDEVRVAAQSHAGWRPSAAVDLRDPLGAEAEVDRAHAAGVRALRLAPDRQQVPVPTPGLHAVSDRATELGMVLLVEGDLRVVGPALTGRGASVIFLDAHFYHLGDAVILARDEPGFHLSTRLLGNPDGWETVIERLGAQRLVFGTRAPWFEAAAVLNRLATARLDQEALALVTHGNLRRLLGEATS